MLWKFIALGIGVIFLILVVQFLRRAWKIKRRDYPNLTYFKRKRNKGILLFLPFSLLCLLLAIFLPVFGMSCPYVAKLSQHTSLFVCAPGTITISGSTALKPLVEAAANSYMTKCGSATIKFGSGRGSLQGLYDVEKGYVDIGDSDVLAPSSPGYKDLVDHPVAAVVYVMIVNPSLDIKSLSTNQIQNIYNRTYKHWEDAKLSRGPIVAYTRDACSGSWATFAEYVLLGEQDAGKPVSTTSQSSCGSDTTQDMINAVEGNEGAIGYASDSNAEPEANAGKLKIVNIDGYSSHSDMDNGRYQFWNVEHMYTKFHYNTPLSDAFINYMSNEANIGDIISSQGFVPLSKIIGLLDGHCPQQC